MPFRDPAANIAGGFDRCVTVCRNKGTGWHLMTNAAWAAVALWCKKSGFMPGGNNNYGQDISATHEKGVPAYKETSGAFRTLRTATGSGPPSWYHNNDMSGIADLNSNVWEWVGGMRLNDGEIQIIPQGDAMKPDCNMSDTSTEWKAIMPDGTLVSSGTAGTVKYTKAYNSTKFASITTTPAATGAGSLLLESLALIPRAGSVSADYGNDSVWANLSSEKMLARGGGRSETVNAGVFAISLNFERLYVSTNVGFRSAYYE